MTCPGFPSTFSPPLPLLLSFSLLVYLFLLGALVLVAGIKHRLLDELDQLVLGLLGNLGGLCHPIGNSGHNNCGSDLGRNVTDLGQGRVQTVGGKFLLADIPGQGFRGGEHHVVGNAGGFSQNRPQSQTRENVPNNSNRNRNSQ